MRLRRPAVAFSIVLFVALSLAVAGAGAARVVSVGSASNGKSVSLHSDDWLVVSLKGNATTGYAWRVKCVTKSVLKPRAVTYVPNPNPKHLMGVGGVYKLQLKALKKGTTTLRLKYLRSWSGENGGSYTLRVVVS